MITIGWWIYSSRNCKNFSYLIVIALVPIDNSNKMGLIMEEEKRLCPRIELDLPVAIKGLKGINKTKDFSTGGMFIQTPNIAHFKPGDDIYLAAKLPLEEKPVKLRAEVAHVARSGIGVKFKDILGSVHNAIENTFRVFQATIPLPGSV